jgi:MFS transporter, BCD family, chlorophyll transporter
VIVGQKRRRRLDGPGAVRRWLDRHASVRRWLSLLRLGLFQFAVGLSIAPIAGTLNRVLIDELAIPALAVGFLISIHYFVSPVRALVGFHTDQRRARGHWRTPYIVLGVMMTYGGLATAPFALILLGGNGVLSFWPAMIVCTLIFLAYGIGINIVETTYLALVSDITPPHERGRVLAVLWMMLVLGTILSSIAMSLLLQHYTHVRLIRLMQGSAVIFVVLTWIALWQQERLKPNGQIDAPFREIRVRLSLWASVRMLAGQRALRSLFAVLFVATAAFATHDVLLEPYGGQVLGMSVAATTQLTAFWGVAMLLAIALAGIALRQDRSSLLLIGLGCAVGAAGFGGVAYASEGASIALFRGGVWLIGMGRGLFLVGSVALVMSLADSEHIGLFLGLWGVMQALAQGLGVIGGGLVRDLTLYQTGNVVVGYTTVYGASLGLLVVALVLLGALRLQHQLRTDTLRSPWAGLQDIPGDQLIY